MGRCSITIGVSFIVLLCIQLIYLPMLTSKTMATTIIPSSNFSQYFIDPTAVSKKPSRVVVDKKNDIINVVKKKDKDQNAISTISSSPTANAIATTTTTNNNNTSSSKYWWKRTTQSSNALLDDIDLEVINTTTTCGFWKCYFASKSWPNKYGYLIGQDRRMKNEILKAIEENKNSTNNNTKQPEISLEYAQKTYDFTMRIQQTYGIRHLMVSPPIHILNCTKELADVLNMGLKSYNNKNNVKTIFLKRFREAKDNYNPKYLNSRDDALFIQVVQKAPEPNFVYTPSRNKIFGIPGAQSFLQSIRQPDDDFKRNLRNDWNSTYYAWKDNPILLQDFQFLLDYQGKIWQIDIDRINNGNFEPNNTVFSKNIDWSVANNTLYTLDKVQNNIINPLLYEKWPYHDKKQNKTSE